MSKKQKRTIVDGDLPSLLSTTVIIAIQAQSFGNILLSRIADSKGKKDQSNS